MANSSASALVEAILLVSPQPTSLDVLTTATDLTEAQVNEALARLEKKFASANSGIVLRKVAGGYQLATNPTCAEAVERFREESRPTALSNAAHEVLSCALYLGPLTRAAISGVRGVNSDAVVRNLFERGLLAEVGADSESPGSPSLLNVTSEFYAAAGSDSRDDFPPIDALVGEAEIGRVRERLGAASDNSAATMPQEES
ncbi:SMC-Scp complex subunit ScpB [soil metagenome]